MTAHAGSPMTKRPKRPTDPNQLAKRIIDIATGNDAPILASLTSTVGQIIKIYTVQQGVNWLNLENFARGIYFLKVQIAPDNIQIRKLVIQ